MTSLFTPFSRLAIFAAGFCTVAALSAATHPMKNLRRGVVAVRASSTEVSVSWRVLGPDPVDLSFNLYRSTGGGAATILNATPL